MGGRGSEDTRITQPWPTSDKKQRSAKTGWKKPMLPNLERRSRARARIRDQKQQECTVWKCMWNKRYWKKCWCNGNMWRKRKRTGYATSGYPCLGSLLILPTPMGACSCIFAQCYSERGQDRRGVFDVLDHQNSHLNISGYPLVLLGKKYKKLNIKYLYFDWFFLPRL